MSSGWVGKAIVLTCFFTAGYGWHRKLGVGFCTAGYGWHRGQWVNKNYFKAFGCNVIELSLLFEIATMDIIHLWHKQ